MSSVDAESLQATSRQRGRCMDAFLLGSVLTLFAMLLSGAALAVWVVNDLRANMERVSRTQSDTPAHAGLFNAPMNINSSYEMQNFAYLRAVSSFLKNGRMEWESINIRNTNTVGSLYDYKPKQQALTLLQEGSYFLYIELNLSCISYGSPRFLSVTIEDKDTQHLTCSLDLIWPGPAVKRCWVVILNLPKDHRLMASMYINDTSDGWKLDLNHSGFGVFLVDGLGTKK